MDGWACQEHVSYTVRLPVCELNACQPLNQVEGLMKRQSEHSKKKKHRDDDSVSSLKGQTLDDLQHIRDDSACFLILRLRTLLLTLDAGQAAFVVVALSDLDNRVSSGIRGLQTCSTWSTTMEVVRVRDRTNPILDTHTMIEKERTEPKERPHLGRNLLEVPPSVDDMITHKIQLVLGSVVRFGSAV